MDTFDVKTHTELCWTEYNPFNSTCPSTVKIYMLSVYIHLWIDGTQQIACSSGYWCYVSLHPDIVCHWDSSTDTKILSQCFQIDGWIEQYVGTVVSLTWALLQGTHLNFHISLLRHFQGHLFTMILFQSTNKCVQAFIDRSLSFPRVCWVAVAIFRILLWVQEILDIS